MSEVRILHGDALEMLRTLPAESVQVCVTSPPYYGLRQYIKPGHPDYAKQIGLEPTFDCLGWARAPRCGVCFICRLTAVFREVRRVLRKDGTLFLNVGDSYFGGGRGGGGSFEPERRGWREVPCGTSDKEPEGSQARGCLCGSLCGVCRAVYQSHISRNGTLLVSMLRSSLAWSSRAHMESSSGRVPTLDLTHLADHTGDANLGLVGKEALLPSLLRASLVSMLGEFSPQLLDVCLRRASRGECLLCARSLGDCAPACAGTTACTCGIALQSGASGRRTSGTASSGSACRDSTNAFLKPKDLLLQPERLALSLQADGWYLRSRIIWHKLAPMPESVTDRPTKAHEHIWLLSKSERYYYDAAAAKEPVTQDERRPTFRGGAYCNNATFDNAEGGQSTDIGNVRVKRSGNKARKPASARGVPVDDDGSTSGAVAGSVPWEGTMRNWRDVWPIGPEPYKGEHFATFPSEIPRRAIIAGSRAGDTVLDPFAGTGTTGRVAAELGRHAIMIELAEHYERDIRARTTGFTVGLPLGAAA